MSSQNLNFLVLVTTTFFLSSTAFSIADLSPLRFLVIFNLKGEPEIIDTAAPLPEVNVTESEIRLYLYTIQNRNNPENLSLSVQDLEESKYFDKSKLNVFLVHGWSSNYKGEFNVNITDAYLNVTDVNVFVFDWSRYGDRLYTLAYASGAEVGQCLGKFVLSMQDYFDLDSSSFRLIGHSLGAHLVGVAGKAANGNVDLIVGLDPAGPLYFPLITNNRIETNSAKYVQIIHTNAGKLGYLGDLGDADFWPNGGIRQPGCGIDLSGSCSHARSFKYYAESVRNGGFASKSCYSHLSYTLNTCSSQNLTHLGGLDVDTEAQGNYYLDTGSSYPFSSD